MLTGHTLELLVQYDVIAPRAMERVLDALDAPQLREERPIARRAGGREQRAQRPVHAVLQREHIPATVLPPVA